MYQPRPGLRGRRKTNRSRAQAAVEVALVAPFLLLMLGGVVDVGRAFYYRIAVANAAREAAHWASLPDRLSRTPPTDEQVGTDVDAPSQETFGLSLQLAPLCSTGLQTDNCNSTTIRHAAPPITGTLVDTTPMDDPLGPNSAWLFVYPNKAGRTAMLPGAAQVAWHLVKESTRLVSVPGPEQGGAQRALALAGQILPVDASASDGRGLPLTASQKGCYLFGTPTISPASATNVDPGSDLSFTVSLPVTGDGTTPKNSALLAISAVNPTYNGTYNQLWSPANGNNSSQALLQLASGSSYTEQATLNLHIGSNTSANSYSFTVQATSSGGGCTPGSPTNNFTVAVNGVSPPSPGTTPDDFSIAANPAIVGTTPGNPVSTNITVQPQGTFNSDVSVTATIPPSASGVTVSPSPLTFTGGTGTQALTFSTAPSTCPSGGCAYAITITGTSGALTHSTTVELDIGSGAAASTVVGSTPPRAHQIICTVVYYYTPISPELGILLPNSRLYIIAAATLEAVY